MIGRPLLYGYAFTLLLATLALRAEAERPAEKAPPWAPLRNEIFELAEKGSLPAAAQKADELLKIVRSEGSTSDEIDALGIRGRVAADAEGRRAYYEAAYDLAKRTLFEKGQVGTGHLALSHAQRDLGDLALERDDKPAARRFYQGSVDSLAAFDLQTYLTYSVSPDARYGPSANELRFVVGWLNLSEGRVADAEASFLLSERGMRLNGIRVDDSVRLGLAVVARHRGDRRAAEALLREVEGRQKPGRGLASANLYSPELPHLVKLTRSFLKSGDLADLRW